MTGILPGAVARFVAENNYGRISQTAGLISVGLLIALMIEKELLLAAAQDGDSPAPIRWLNTAIVPLLIVFVLIVGARFAELLG